ncbi:receptor expression-enhancing protein 5-like [Watersipora subatra]|uniref:receptor expression-enhancing protein 5-like n=1 Tax=Watersipora subatra TaxID=2589382 RepID=UPI00355C1D22
MAKVKENFEQYKEWLNKKLHEKNAVTDVIDKVEKATGVQRLYMAYGVMAIVALWLLLGFGAQILCNFIGFLYPGYASFKAIESHDKSDDTQWLIYWVVYGTFALVELGTDIFLFWIPFYWFFKCAFLIWCMVPNSWNGSSFVYYKFIRPFILRYEDQIESRLDQVKDAGGKLISEGAKLADEAKDAAASAAADKAFNKSE